MEKLDQEVDSKVSFDVLMLGSDEGVEVGSPTLPARRSRARSLRRVKGEKIIIYKYKSKKNYHRKAGHRQAYTKVEITAVG